MLSFECFCGKTNISFKSFDIESIRGVAILSVRKHALVGNDRHGLFHAKASQCAVETFQTADVCVRLFVAAFAVLASVCTFVRHVVLVVEGQRCVLSRRSRMMKIVDLHCGSKHSGGKSLATRRTAVVSRLP